ncbi:MAG: c-type cytochrome [Cyclobacteriaceae bacterium]
MNLHLIIGSALLFFLSFLFVRCGGGQFQNEATADLSMQDKMYYEQYMVHGERLYKQQCANCHQEDGSGLGRLIPPLAQSDYMLEDVGRTLCIIRNGMEGEIIVNGQHYKQEMPANEKLTDIEVAQIATYVYNSWGNAQGFIPVREASAYLDACK